MTNDLMRFHFTEPDDPPRTAQEIVDDYEASHPNGCECPLGHPPCSYCTDAPEEVVNAREDLARIQ